MSLTVWTATAGQPLNLRDESDFRDKSGGGVLVVVSEGRAVLAAGSWVPVSLWCAVRGRARVLGRDLQAECGADEVYVAEHGQRLTAQPLGSPETSLLGVLLPAERVADLAKRELGLAPEDPLVFPALARHDASLNVPLLHLAHAALRRGESANAGERAVNDVIAQLLRRQVGYEAWIARCPGRSMRYRRQLFLRLLRARNHIELSQGADASLARLAEVARLSPTHFLRLYHQVFGQTPHKHVIQTRLLAARDLLLRSSLGVSDVCRTLGFENRCAFARVFKQHFGTSPSAMRQHAEARSSAPRLGTDGHAGTQLALA